VEKSQSGGEKNLSALAGQRRQIFPDLAESEKNLSVHKSGLAELIR